MGDGVDARAAGVFHGLDLLLGVHDRGVDCAEGFFEPEGFPALQQKAVG
jgi:hypothetical protein